ncbi:General stress protein 69 [Microbacterium oleivorans]|uniref:aldo/keto reductase n=1 Tax=Microbacterium oleivorans TaxID=273677 RepID=UPI000977A83D|nr:aldo/keto reductase [Microbacterium oleivorans]AZS42968.1 General stress protein 69 [Microbacterium oleivorans]
MSQRTLGPFTVSAIGLGAMPVSMNGNGIPSHDDAVATVRAALDAGVTFVDTADIYAPSWDQMGHNERIVGDALAGWDGDRSSIVVATKGGITRTEQKDFGRDGSLEYLRSAVQKSLKNLQVDVIDLYQYHRPDRWMVYGEVMQNLKTLQDEGLVRTLGISNASVEEIQIAQEVLGEGNLTSVQNEFSPRHPGSYGELTYCVEHGIAFLPWSPLGGIGGAGSIGERFAAFAEIGADHGVSPQQVVLAWELSLGETVIPIPGASRPASITDSAKARDLVLSTDELARCSAAVGIEV